MAVLKTTFGYTPKDVFKRMSCEQIRGLIEGYNSYKSVVYSGAKDTASQTVESGGVNWDEIEEVSEDDQLELMRHMGLITDGG